MNGSNGVRWLCPNRDCNTWFVQPVKKQNDAIPRICGSTMRREDGLSVLRYLDFLRDGTASSQEVVADKE
jgi:hypothetical protein